MRVLTSSEDAAIDFFEDEITVKKKWPILKK